LDYLREQTWLVGIDQLASPEDRLTYGLDPARAPTIALAAGQRSGLRRHYSLMPEWRNTLEPLSGRLETFLSWQGGPKGTVEANR